MPLNNLSRKIITLLLWMYSSFVLALNFDSLEAKIKTEKIDSVKFRMYIELNDEFFIKTLVNAQNICIKQKIFQAFKEWKAGYEQVDDMLVIGVRV